MFMNDLSKLTCKLRPLSVAPSPPAVALQNHNSNHPNVLLPHFSHHHLQQKLTYITYSKIICLPTPNLSDTKGQAITHLVLKIENNTYPPQLADVWFGYIYTLQQPNYNIHIYIKTHFIISRV